MSIEYQRNDIWLNSLTTSNFLYLRKLSNNYKRMLECFAEMQLYLCKSMNKNRETQGFYRFLSFKRKKTIVS